MAHVRAARLLLPGWLERGNGHLICTVSAAGLLTMLGSAPYSVTKHAALSFAEWLAATYAHRGLTVQALCPMGVRTAMLAGISPAAELILGETAIEPPRTWRTPWSPAIADGRLPDPAAPRRGPDVREPRHRHRPLAARHEQAAAADRDGGVGRVPGGRCRAQSAGRAPGTGTRGSPAASNPTLSYSRPAAARDGREVRSTVLAPAARARPIASTGELRRRCPGPWPPRPPPRPRSRRGTRWGSGTSPASACRRSCRSARATSSVTAGEPTMRLQRGPVGRAGGRGQLRNEPGKRRDHLVGHLVNHLNSHAGQITLPSRPGAAVRHDRDEPSTGTRQRRHHRRGLGGGPGRRAGRPRARPDRRGPDRGHVRRRAGRRPAHLGNPAGGPVPGPVRAVRRSRSPPPWAGS